MPDLGTAGSVVSIAGGVSSLFGGDDTASQAGAAADAATIAAQTQAGVAAKQEARNDEAWARFKEKYYPLEDKLLDPAYRDVQDKSELRAAEAGDAVSSAFDAQRGQSTRALTRVGVNPADGEFRALNRRFDMGEAATSADVKNDARVAEKQRVEDTNFARALQVMSLGRNIPAQVSSGSSSAAAAYGNNAGIYSNLAQMLAKDSGQASSGGIQAITRGLNGLNNANSWDPGGNTFTGNSSSVPEFGSPEYTYAANNMFEEGGEVRGPSHDRGGVDIEAEGGEYVLPIEVVRDVGVAKLDAMVASAKKRIADRDKQKQRPPQAMRRA